MNKSRPRMGLRAKDYNDLKSKAYKLAVQWSEHDFSHDWKKSYMEQYRQTARLNAFDKMVELYGGYLAGIIDVDTAIEYMADIKRNYHLQKESEEKKLVILMFSFNQAVQNAFELAGKEFGEVRFKCPFCQGDAFGARYSTPENEAHSVTIRAGCTGCGHSVMN